MIEERQKPDVKKRGLGRGLDALFGDEEANFVTPNTVSDDKGTGTSRKMAGIDQLEPGKYQPRQQISPESLEELSNSIKIHGILQPILVRPKGNSDRYEIIAGERRWRAAQKAQLHEVPIVVKELSDVQALEIALIENLQRSDLNILEEAQGYQRLMSEFSHTQEKLATVIGKSRSHIANTMRLLSLPPGVQTLVRQGKLSAGHARALITAKNPEELAKIVLNQNLSVRQTEKLAAGEGGGRKSKPGKSSSSAGKDVNTLALEKEVSEKLGLKVSVDIAGYRDGVMPHGAIRVEFKNLDQLDHLVRKLTAR